MHLPLRWLAPHAHLPNPPTLHTYPTLLLHTLPNTLTLWTYPISYLAHSSCQSPYFLPCTHNFCPLILHIYPNFLSCTHNLPSTTLYTYLISCHAHSHFLSPCTLTLPSCLAYCTTLLPYTLTLLLPCSVYSAHSSFPLTLHTGELRESDKEVRGFLCWKRLYVPGLFGEGDSAFHHTSW
jgi:hypothetical protein